MKRTLLIGVVCASLAMPATAATIIVAAQANSRNGGIPVVAGVLMSGQSLTIASSTDDLWSAGALPRFSDANGLTGTRFATASDDSGQSPGTQIGTDFGLYSFDGFSAPFGALVGRIGGVYQLLGANFNGTAWNTGALELYYWDSNNGDNFGDIAFNVTSTSAVPEPRLWALAILGLGVVGAGLRSQRKRRVSLTYV